MKNFQSSWDDDVIDFCDVIIPYIFSDKIKVNHNVQVEFRYIIIQP